MDREKVIKGWKCHMEADTLGCADCPYREGWRTCNYADTLYKDVYDLLKEQEERWIPVTEQLPRSVANKVLVYVQHEDYVGYIGYGHYEKYKGQEMWFDLEHDEEFSKRGYTVTHWMETPMPPMEGR